MSGLITALVFALVMMAPTATTAAAQETAPPLSLTGEQLFDGSGMVEGINYVDGEIPGCNRAGTSTFTYHNTNPYFVAVGPYVGPFTLQGSVSFGPQTEPRGFVPLTSFEGTFTIDSPLGFVEGTLFFGELTQSGGRCYAQDPTIGGVDGAVSPYVSSIQFFALLLRYEATITTTAGVYRDTGTITQFDGSSTAEVYEQAPEAETAFRVGNRYSNLSLGAFESEGVTPLAPATEEQCKNGGYALYGFQNQGQCIQFVNTGK